MNGRFQSGFCDMGEPAPPAVAGPQVFLKGQVVFDQKWRRVKPSLVESGEVLILRNGRAVDIVEAGERLDPSVWAGATAVAWTDCRLVRL